MVGHVVADGQERVPGESQHSFHTVAPGRHPLDPAVDVGEVTDSGAGQDLSQRMHRPIKPHAAR